MRGPARRSPPPASAPPPEEAVPHPGHPKVGVRGHRVLVWDKVVVATHWLIVLSILVLAVTGLYLGRPFAAGEGPSADTFTLVTFKTIHLYAAIVFAAAVVARIIWMFTGTPYASWRELIPVAAHRRRHMWGTFLFYALVRHKPPPTVGHNPLAGATYVLVFGLYILVILSGLALYGASADVDSYTRSFEVFVPLFGGLQPARWVHHVIMWLLLGFMVHHVYSAVLVSAVEKNGTLDSIFSGYKHIVSEHAEGAEDRDDDA